MSSTIYSPSQIRDRHQPLRGDCWRLTARAMPPPLSSDPATAVKVGEILDELVGRPFSDARLDRPFAPRTTQFATRFGRAGKDVAGVYYGAAHKETAVAEVVFHRLLFVAASEGLRPPRSLMFDAFRVPYATDHGCNLRQPPFDATPEAWLSPDDYGSTQALADAAREAGTEIICYASVRDPEERDNLAILRRSAIPTAVPDEECTIKVEFPDGNLTVGTISVTVREQIFHYPLRSFVEKDRRLAPLLER